MKTNYLRVMQTFQKQGICRRNEVFINETKKEDSKNGKEIYRNEVKYQKVYMNQMEAAIILMDDLRGNKVYVYELKKKA